METVDSGTSDDRMEVAQPHSQSEPVPEQMVRIEPAEEPADPVPIPVPVERPDMTEEQLQLFCYQIKQFKELNKKVTAEKARLDALALAATAGAAQRADTTPMTQPTGAGETSGKVASPEPISETQPAVLPKPVKPKSAYKKKKEALAEAARLAALSAQANPASSTVSQAPGTVVAAAPPTVRTVVVPAMSWQCFGSLMYCGPTKISDSCIAIAPGNTAIFSKASTSPFVPTKLYAAVLREKIIQTRLTDSRAVVVCSGRDAARNSSSSSSGDNATPAPAKPASSGALDLFEFQRKTRALMVADLITRRGGDIHPAHTICASLDLVSRAKFIRKKKQKQKDVKAFAISVKKRRVEAEESRRNKNKDFFNVLLGHRDDFIRFHKFKLSEAAKSARAAKAWLENIDTQVNILGVLFPPELSQLNQDFHNMA